MPPETGDVEGGASSSDLFDDVDEIGSDSDSDASNAAGESAEGDGATKFHTYKEPDLSIAGIDVDTNAVAQFVEQFLTVNEAGNKDMKIPVSTVYNKFIMWAELNDIDLDDLSSEQAESQRKGDLKNAVIEHTGVDTGRPTIDDERTRVYYSTELSDLGEELPDTIEDI
jgi:hypothetical protein